MPTVAEVMASASASGQLCSPKPLKAAPSAAAVPWPPTKPAAKIVPKPGRRSGQTNDSTVRLNPKPSPHCSSTRAAEYAPSSVARREPVRQSNACDVNGNAANTSVIRTPGYCDRSGENGSTFKPFGPASRPPNPAMTLAGRNNRCTQTSDVRANSPANSNTLTQPRSPNTLQASRDDIRQFRTSISKRESRQKRADNSVTWR